MRSQIADFSMICRTVFGAGATSGYECVPFILPDNGQVATPNLGRVLLRPSYILVPLALVPTAGMVTDDFTRVFTP
jgi:hypothetical protein